MMRIITTFLMMFLLIGCTHQRTYRDVYAERNYLESINLLATTIEGKSEANFNKTDAAQLRQLVTDVMNKYEDELASTNNTDYKKRIEIYQKLLEMNKRLSNRFYSAELVNFFDKYPDENLRQNIAKDFYDQGVNFETQNDYKAAAEAFSQASSIYQPLSKYKDSDKRAYDNAKKHATLMAEEAYQKGKKLAKGADSRSTFRSVGEYYWQAADVYSRFGRYKDAASLAEKYHNKGLISVYFHSDDLCSDVGSAFSADYLYFVSSLSSADVIISVTCNSRYYSPQQSYNMEIKREKVFDKYVEQTDDQGHTTQVETFKEVSYNESTRTYRNSLTLSTEVSVRGLISSSSSFTIEKSSEKYEVNYWGGDVPSHVHDYNEGVLESPDELEQRAKSEQSSQLRSIIESIVKDLSYL